MTETQQSKEFRSWCCIKGFQVSEITISLGRTYASILKFYPLISLMIQNIWHESQP